MDVYPWPNGLGFEDAPQWWAFAQDQPEAAKIELLLSAALLGKEICRLLLSRDRTLFDAFHLSENVIALLLDIEADTLSEFTVAFLESYNRLQTSNEDIHDDTRS
jgi:hypothetical protein